jgi:hypothetical protein
MKMAGVDITFLSGSRSTFLTGFSVWILFTSPFIGRDGVLYRTWQLTFGFLEWQNDYFS